MFAISKMGSRRATWRLSAMSTAPHFKPAFDPYTYTHGRWLERDEERREMRKLHFNFDALLDLAIKCSPGARQVIDCEKKEGGFNRVFRIFLDNGTSVVARLPTRVAGPRRLAVSSEVATLQFVRERTTIPVPSVLSWSSETDNAVGAEYIIMDTMPGVLLKDVWNTMTASQHIQCIRSMAHLSLQLWNLSFPSYGSLYLKANSPPGAVPLDDTFSIGPLCASHLWGHRTLDASALSTATGSLGPWYSLEAYLWGLLAQARSSTHTNSDQSHGSSLLTSTEAHTALLDTVQEFLKVIIGTDAVKDASHPTLFHPDFHTRNIFVDPEDLTKITGIIDWQSAAVEPSFMLVAETPDFAQEVAHDDCSHETSRSEADELSPQAKIRADAEFCAKTWAVMLHVCPKSRAAYTLDHSLVHILAAGSSGWLKDAVALRQILLELGQKWEQLSLPGQSLYQPGEDEMEELKRQLDTTKTTQRLREHLSRLLGCQTDGWLPTDKWEEALPVYTKEYRCFVECYLEGLATDEEKATAMREAERLWPFDQR